MRSVPLLPDHGVMGYRVLSHTADTGIEADSATLAALIADLASGMFSLMATVDPTQVTHRIEVVLEAGTVEDLVVDALSELLYLSETEDVILCDIRLAVEDDRLRVVIDTGAVPLGSSHTEGPQIKAVTYHDLVVEERGEGWYGRVYFDV